MSKKVVVVKLDLHDGRDKQKAIKAVAAIIGVDAITVDMKSQKMTVVGMVDPVKVMSKLRKAAFPATFVSVGPVKEPEKEEKKDGDAAKKEGEGGRKEGDGEKKKDGEEKKDEEKKDGDGEKAKAAPPPTEQIIAELMNQYRGYHPYAVPPPPPPPPPPPYMSPPPQYYVQSMEENPNSCVIC